MAGLSTQYYNGTDYIQFELDVADYTTGGVVSDIFTCIKDGKDNLYIVCQKSGQFKQLPIIKIGKDGTKTVSLSTQLTWIYRAYQPCNISLSRDEQTLFITGDNGGGTVGLYSIDLQNFTISFVINEAIISPVGKFAIYQDRYIWVASGSTVKIYDYTTKAELASVNNTEPAISICCSTDNTLYGISFRMTGSLGLCKYIYDDIANTLTKTVIGQHLSFAQQAYTLLIDKWGDVVGIRTYNGNSYLFKWNTSGLLLQELNLNGNYANLNTDKDGNYYYSNALGTYKIAANTAQGEAFSGVGTKIRGSGMTTYNNNITGYNPAVFGTQE